ncbi:hypothetical protein Bca4012_039409 [Brassica carinata]
MVLSVTYIVWNCDEKKIILGFQKRRSCENDEMGEVTSLVNAFRIYMVVKNNDGGPVNVYHCLQKRRR